MYTRLDQLREYDEKEKDHEPYSRTPFRRDYGRLIHSPAFRRLQGKTQLYPGLESDFFRNRLTHSLEVAQIAKTIAIILNAKYLNEKGVDVINPDICEFAGLAHDLGHPPFGHQGEEALDECMREFGGFEGNAQTLRIISRIEKKIKLDDESIKKNQEFRFGLNLTFRSLASVLKYDNEIPLTSKNRSEENKRKAIKGYYASESALVNKIKTTITGSRYNKKFKTIECQIMDIADDIAYSTYDLEDGFKAGFYHPVDFFSYPDVIFENVAKKVSKAVSKKISSNQIKEELFKIFSNIYNSNDLPQSQPNTFNDEYFLINKESAEIIFANVVNFTTKASKSIAEDGYLRTEFTSALVNQAIDDVCIDIDNQHPSMSKVYLNDESRIRVETMKNFTYESQILSPRLKVAEYRGKDIVKGIFSALSKDEGYRLMPMDYQKLFFHFNKKRDRYRCISDFVAGMTDKYAIEFYGRLKSENPETIFKPF